MQETSGDVMVKRGKWSVEGFMRIELEELSK